MKKRILTLIIVQIFIASAIGQKVVKVGAFNLYPAIYQDADGQVKGFYVDALDELAKKENIQFEYIYGSWQDGLSWIKSGKVDMLTSVAYTEERSRYMDYCEVPLLTVWGEVYVKPGSEINGILDLQGKKIALMQSDINGKHLVDLASKLGIECNFIKAKDFDEVFTLTASGAVDAGVVNNTFGAPKHVEYSLRSTGIVLNPFDIFFTVKKNENKRLLRLLNNYMSRWKHDANSVYNEARQKWSHGEIGKMEVIPKWLERVFYLTVGLIVILLIFISLLRYRVRIATRRAMKSKDYWQTTFDAIDDIVMLLSLDHEIIEINKAGENALQLEKKDIIGKNCYELVHNCSVPIIEFPCKSVIKGKDIEVNEYEDNGRIYQLTIYPVINKKGKVEYLTHIVKDITDYKNSEKNLKESEERFRALHNASFGGIAIHDKGIILECNYGLSEMTGYSFDELIGMDGLLLIAKESRDLVRQKIASGDEKPYEAIGIRKDGEKYALHLEARNIPYKSKKVRTVEFRDITESKQAEEALRKSEAIKNKMVSNIGDVIVIIDKKGINTYKSPNIETLFGWKPEELTGKNVFDIVHPEDIGQVKKFFDELTVKPNASGTTELRYKRKDGKYVWIEITAVNLLNDKDIKGIMGNYHDISDRKHAEQEIIAAKKKAEESDRLKSAFLANMSHEIRTPINAISGFSNLLLEMEYPKEKVDRFLRIIAARTKDLLAIISDIIDISKIEANQLSIHESAFSLNDLVKEIYDFKLSEGIDDQKIEFKFELGLNKKEDLISADQSRLKQVILNLLSNAFKFTSEGSIKFGYIINQNSELEFFVEDTGIGIEEKASKLIFERFRQLDGSHSRKYGGTGLGLNICKQIVKLMNGNIWVISKEGIGSTFFFTIPFKSLKKEK